MLAAGRGMGRLERRATRNLGERASSQACGSCSKPAHRATALSSPLWCGLTPNCKSCGTGWPAVSPAAMGRNETCGFQQPSLDWAHMLVSSRGSLLAASSQGRSSQQPAAEWPHGHPHILGARALNFGTEPLTPLVLKSAG